MLGLRCDDIEDDASVTNDSKVRKCTKSLTSVNRLCNAAQMIARITFDFLAPEHSALDNRSGECKVGGLIVDTTV